MALKSLFSAMKKEGYIIKPLDLYLLSLNATDDDRARNVNAPSMSGNCLRANYYSRMGYKRDGSIEPRTRRIFNNGDGVHDRLQGYLEDCDILLMREVPLINEPYNIQGHTDGYLDIRDKPKDPKEVAILEIKSINENGFTQLKEPKEPHKLQGATYVYCAEERRKYLRKKYETLKDFNQSFFKRKKYFTEKYQYFKDGSRFTREEKIQMQVKLNLQSDKILYSLDKPVTKVIFLYENKNNQDLKEFCYEPPKNVTNYVLSRNKELNEYIDKKKLPEREGTSKSCEVCRYCDYKLECWL